MWKEDDILRILKLEDGKKQRIYLPLRSLDHAFFYTINFLATND